jgi:hypothetical protein
MTRAPADSAAALDVSHSAVAIYLSHDVGEIGLGTGMGDREIKSVFGAPKRMSAVSFYLRALPMRPG